MKRVEEEACEKKAYCAQIAKQIKDYLSSFSYRNLKLRNFDSVTICSVTDLAVFDFRVGLSGSAKTFAKTLPNATHHRAHISNINTVLVLSFTPPMMLLRRSFLAIGRRAAAKPTTYIAPRPFTTSIVRRKLSALAFVALLSRAFRC